MTTILIAQSWRVGAANNTKPWHIIANRADGKGASLNALCGTETSGEKRAERVPADWSGDGRKRCQRCKMALRRGGTYEVAEIATPAALDIPAAVRDYVEAEWHGAGIIALNVAQAGIVTALMAADPNLSETAATFRFHKLVDEYRGNGEVSLKPVTDTITESEAERLANLRDCLDNRRGGLHCTHYQEGDGDCHDCGRANYCPDGGVVIVAAGRRRWIKPGAFRVA